MDFTFGIPSTSKKFLHGELKSDLLFFIDSERTSVNKSISSKIISELSDNELDYLLNVLIQNLPDRIIIRHGVREHALTVSDCSSTFPSNRSIYFMWLRLKKSIS